MYQLSHSPERRIAARVAIERPVAVAVANNVSERAARTVNVSTSGMLVTLDGELTIWADVTLVLPELGRREARVVRRDGASYGLVFREPLTAEEFAGFTGVELAPEEPAVRDPEPAKRPSRTAPWAFGRDRFKTVKREAAERARPPAR